jgi:OOP family OmpA-OmpF porin
MNHRITYTVLLCSLFALSEVFGQNGRTYEGAHKMNTWSVTGYGGITRFFGDLRQHDFKRGENESLTGAWGISVNKQLTPLFGVQASFSNGSLAGSKNNVPAFDLATRQPVTGSDGRPQLFDVYFKSPSYIQATLDGTVNLNRLFFGHNKMRTWKIDAHGGFGIMYFYSELYDSYDDRLMLRSNTDASSKTAGTWQRNGSTYTREWVFPVGLSFHYELTPRFDLGLHFTYNHVNTEKIDLTVGDLTNYDTQSGLWGFYLGESKKDKYAFGSVALTYKIGKNAVKAPKTGQTDASRGRYHLRYASPAQLLPPVYNPTLSDADSIAKANMPEAVDPRLYTDTDGDGVADLFDKEPNTPEGSWVSGGGVAMDLNQLVDDAIPKDKLKKDDCDALFGSIEFDTDRSTIRSDSRSSLAQLVALLQSKPDCRVVLVGHADARASDSYNRSLSKRRVDATKRELIKLGFSNPSRITTEYFGELVPISDNRSKAGMQANRRVEIRILPSNSLYGSYPAGFRPN